jgi:hypothetical protein
MIQYDYRSVIGEITPVQGMKFKHGLSLQFISKGIAIVKGIQLMHWDPHDWQSITKVWFAFDFARFIRV